jgi:antitoxin component of MazEF toxin-antitoxin module
MAMHSRLSPRGHLKIPRRICQIIGLEPGDYVTFEIADDRTLVVRRAVDTDDVFNLSVSDSLEEWASEHDRQAFRNL